MLNIVTIILSGALSFVVAFCTSIWAKKTESRKLIFQERCALYLELSKHLDKLVRDTSLVLNQDFVLGLIEFNNRIKLLSCKSTMSAYKKMYDFFVYKNSKYYEWYNENDPNNDEGLFQQMDDGEWVAVVDQFQWESFLSDSENKIRELSPTYTEIKKYLDDLYDAMRKELNAGTPIN